jgi:hypothetical protein
MRVLVLLALLTGCTEIQCHQSMSPILSSGVDIPHDIKIEGIFLSTNCKVQNETNTDHHQ